MSYYDTFLATNKSPKKHFKDNLQAVVNETFKSSTTYQTDVEEEIHFGSLEFIPVEVRVTTLIDPRTGDRVSDDFRQLIFRDLSHAPSIGTRYRFEDNIWIIYATDNIKTDVSSAYVRRCNNTLGIQDKYGNIYKEPCYIDYKPTKTSVLENYTMTVPYTKQVVYCQLNSHTANIEINHRFIFGRDAYKVSDRIKFNKVNTFDPNGAKMLRMYVDYDNLNEYDNIELEVADYKIPEYSIQIQDELIGVQNASGILSYKVLLKGSEVDEGVYWYTDNESVVSINKQTGEYILLNEGEANITCKMINNEQVFYKNVAVKVINTEVEIVENKILPDVSRIALNRTQNFSVKEYINGNETNSKFDIKFYDMPSKNYIAEVTDNGFSIKNLKTNSDVLLKVVCINKESSVQIEKYIELGGIF